MGNACSSRNTQSDDDVRHAQNRPQPRPAPRHRHANGNAVANANPGGDVDDVFDEDGEIGEEEDEGIDDFDLDEKERDDEIDSGILDWLKLTAIPLMAMAGAYYLSRQLKVSADLAAQIAGDSARQMAGVDSEQIPARFAAGCVSDCTLKNLKTVTTENVQKNASRGAVMGSRTLHRAYAAGDNFAPPRIYHNYWAAGGFPTQYYSKSDAIKNYRFTRIFGW